MTVLNLWFDKIKGWCTDGQNHIALSASFQSHLFLWYCVPQRNKMILKKCFILLTSVVSSNYQIACKGHPKLLNFNIYFKLWNQPKRFSTLKLLKCRLELQITTYRKEKIIKHWLPFENVVKNSFSKIPIWLIIK